MIEALLVWGWGCMLSNKESYGSKKHIMLWNLDRSWLEWLFWARGWQDTCWFWPVFVWWSFWKRDSSKIHFISGWQNQWKSYQFTYGRWVQRFQPFTCPTDAHERFKHLSELLGNRCPKHWNGNSGHACSVSHLCLRSIQCKILIPISISLYRCFICWANVFKIWYISGKSTLNIYTYK